MKSNFICGTLEGFYGRPWRLDQRLQLFEWMHEWDGMNTYMYAPKDDLYHRSKWRELYPDKELSVLKNLIQSCHKKELDFIYAIAPGLDIMYSDENDWNFLVKKVNQLREIGCKQFAILFDDIPSKLSDNDQNSFSSFARAHAQITNRLFKHLSGLSLLFCPTVYCGQMADYDIKGNAYLNELGELLHEEIGIFWTGPKVVSVEIKVESIKELQQVIKRKPIIWDNFHANDYDIRQIFFGPYSGRSLELKNEVAGILSNPNCQFWANYNPLRTLGMFNVEIDSWNPRQAFLESSREWIRYFGNEELTVDEIQLLGDCYYTQGQMGEHGIQIIKSIQWILNHPTEEWNDHLDTFKSFEVRLNSLCAKLMATTNRELLYDFYLLLWELSEEMEYVSNYIHWKLTGDGELKLSEFVPRRKGILYEIQEIIHSD